MTISPLAGKPAPKEMLIDVARLETCLDGKEVAQHVRARALARDPQVLSLEVRRRLDLVRLGRGHELDLTEGCIELDDIDELLAKNAVTRLTLSLMYATDFFDQVEHRILPALRSGTVVLADRFIFTLIARGVVRGINRDYISGLYAMALRPHLTFWLNVRPETAFAREFKKAQAISYWEAGRDMSLSHDLYWSFIRYQTMIKREFEVMAKRHNFIELDGEASVSAVNKQLRHRIGEQLGIRAIKYTPSAALAHLWR